MPESLSESNTSSSLHIEKELYYHGMLPKEDVRMLLEKNGDYLVRMAETEPNGPRSYVLTVLVNNTLNEAESMKHFVINCSEKKYYINMSESFLSIQKLLYHYTKTNAEVQDGIKIVAPILRHYWELDHEAITLQNMLGKGAFGEVSAGTMRYKKGTGTTKTVQVAVKQIKTGTMSKENMKRFMLEARNMRKLGHMNVVTFYGVAVLQEPIYLVMELASNGALDSFIKKNPDMTLEKRYDCLLQAAWGLEYIHGKPMLHRDIAARNCLFDDGKVKISDFGLARSGTFYLMTPGMRAPVRWSSIETMKSQIYTQKTDVWSYGILCHEVFTNASEPYPGLTTAEVMEKVQAGHRMAPPPQIHVEVQAMMMKCTSENPNDRPTMPEIAVILQRVTGIHRPNFAAHAKKEAEELLMMTKRRTHRGHKKENHVKKSGSRSASVPKGM